MCQLNDFQKKAIEESEREIGRRHSLKTELVEAAYKHFKPIFPDIQISANKDHLVLYGDSLYPRSRSFLVIYDGIRGSWDITDIASYGLYLGYKKSEKTI